VSKTVDISEKPAWSRKQAELCLLPASSWSHCLLFDPEDGGHIFSEMLVDCHQATWHYTSEDRTLQSLLCKPQIRYIFLKGNNQIVHLQCHFLYKTEDSSSLADKVLYWLLVNKMFIQKHCIFNLQYLITFLCKVLRTQFQIWRQGEKGTYFTWINVLTMVTMKTTVLWQMILHSLENRYQCFEETYYLHLQDKRVTTLKMDIHT
jgi:hypothetical protein